ncbi:hypothetical protein SFOMI_4484 [Sphingobium fuliginis]|uniref:Uncharacterized protein n=1 Tax=Sphingobium fuliginis (strain ATCC 27551) TaxID=336203 RepID=A0A292ZLW1_SPHSA|nr:hypothetical protein SFOMI_4484 [Sphingobium fuliginis]
MQEGWEKMTRPSSATATGSVLSASFCKRAAPGQSPALGGPPPARRGRGARQLRPFWRNSRPEGPFHGRNACSCGGSEPGRRSCRRRERRPEGSGRGHFPIRKRQ